MNASDLPVNDHRSECIIDDMREFRSYNIVDDTIFIRWDTMIGDKHVELHDEISSRHLNQLIKGLRKKARKYFEEIESRAVA